MKNETQHYVHFLDFPLILFSFCELLDDFRFEALTQNKVSSGRIQT